MINYNELMNYLFHGTIPALKNVPIENRLHNFSKITWQFTPVFTESVILPRSEIPLFQLKGSLKQKLGYRPQIGLQCSF